MAGQKQQPAPEPQPVPESEWEWPTEGGHYVRDPITGKIRPEES